MSKRKAEQRLKERAQGRCEQCGAPDLRITHLNGDKKDWSEGNVRMLCYHCWARQYWGRRRRERKVEKELADGVQSLFRESVSHKE